LDLYLVDDEEDEEKGLEFELGGAFVCVFGFEVDAPCPGTLETAEIARDGCCCWLPKPPFPFPPVMKGTLNPFCFVSSAPVLCIPVPAPTPLTGNVLVRLIPRGGGRVDCDRDGCCGWDCVALGAVVTEFDVLDVAVNVDAEVPLEEVLELRRDTVGCPCGCGA
jgi:hypothetical protein